MAISGTIFDIKQFALHDGPGIRTTVFFKGCPLDCFWCHNPESRLLEPLTYTKNHTRNATHIISTKTIGQTVTPETVIDKIAKDEIFYEQSCGGVTFSGGEPMMQIDFLFELLKICKSNNWHTAVDTCGYAPWEDFKKINNLVDLFLFDLKPIDEAEHIKHTRESNNLILKNLTKLAPIAKDIILRIPLIPGITDSDDNLNKSADFIKHIPQLKKIELLPYNMLGQDKIERYNLDRMKPDLKTQDNDKINHCLTLLKQRGFEVNIGT